MSVTDPTIVIEALLMAAILASMARAKGKGGRMSPIRVPRFIRRFGRAAKEK